MECLWCSLHYPPPFSPLTFHSASMLWPSFLPSASPHRFPASRAAQLRASPSLKPHPKPYCTLTANVPTTVATTATSSAPLKKVLVPIAHGTEEMEAVIMVDVLRRAGADVTVASVEPQLEVETSGGIKLVADTSITSCCNEVFDLIALPGGMPGSARLRDCEVLQKMTSRQAEEKRLYGAISAAPAVTLLPWGLLRRKKITCHPAFTDKLSRFWAVKSNIQVSGELTTSRGPGTSFDFALSLVQQLFGESTSKEVRDLLLLNASEDHSIKEETNKVEWAVDHIPRVLIPVANGSEEIEVVTIVDILRRAKVYVTIASVEKSLHILASQGIKIIADMSIGMAAESTYDLIILPGEVAGFERLNKSKVLKKLLKDQESAGRIYGAICFSPALMQRNKEKKAMGQTSVINMLKSKMVDSARIVIDGRVITSSGVATVTDFALAIVSKLFGHARARSVAEGLVFEYSRS